MVRTLRALVLALAIPALANGDEVERKARELEAVLIAPCCFSQQVSIHQSPAADQVRRDLRERLAAGQTRDAILRAYVQRYGKRILVEPPAEGFDQLLYLFPPVALVISTVLTVSLVRRFTTRSGPTALPAGGIRTALTTTPAGDSERELGARLDEQLRDLD